MARFGRGQPHAPLILRPFGYYTVQIGGTIAGTGTVAGTLSGTFPIGATIAGTGTVTGTAALPVTNIAGEIDGVGGVQLTLPVWLWPFYIQGDTKVGGIATNGIQVAAYLETRFNGILPPTNNTPPPDGDPPDAGPIASDNSFGGTGMFQLNVPTTANYWVMCYDPNFPALTAWEGPLMGTPHTSRNSWTSVTGFGVNRQIPGWAIDVSSDGVTLPASTINVTSLVNPLPTYYSAIGGTLLLASSSWNAPYATVAFTGVTSLGGGVYQFSGCTGGAGFALATGNPLGIAYQAGPLRRTVYAVNTPSVVASGDQARLFVLTTVGGQVVNNQIAGVAAWGATGFLRLSVPLTFTVDPYGWYSIQPLVAGTGTCTLFGWTEVDF